MKHLQTAVAVLVVTLCATLARGEPFRLSNSTAQVARLPPVAAAKISGPPTNSPVRLTLAELEMRAVECNPAIAQAAAAVRAAQGNWRQAGLPPNPTVGLGQAQTGSDGRAEQDYVAISQELVLGGKLRLSREVAAREIARAEQELAAQRVRVLADVRIAFYTAMIAQKQHAVADELVQIARLGLEASLETAASDQPTERNDMLEARIELRAAEIEARNSVNRHLAAWRSLSAVAGDPALPPCELASDVETVPPERQWLDVLRRLQGESPEIAVAVAQIERARAAWRRAAVERTPNVTLDAVVNWRDNGIGGDSDGGMQMSVPLPIWDRNQGAVDQAAAEIVMAARDLERLELGLQDRLAAVYERYANALYQVRQYREAILPDAQEALRITRENYRAGKVDYDDLLTSQRTNAQANFAHLDALRELWVAETEMEGFLLRGSLSGP